MAKAKVLHLQETKKSEQQPTQTSNLQVSIVTSEVANFLGEIQWAHYEIIAVLGCFRHQV
jgi:hypothetical protein